jgi:hypothetical protein
MSRCQKILIVIGVACAVAILIPVIHHYQLRFAVESYVAQLKAKGEPIELAQVIPLPMPPEQNGSEIFLKAYELIRNTTTFLSTNSPYGKKMVAPGRSKVCFRQPELSEPGEFGFTNSWEQAEAATKQYDEAIKLLRQLGGKQIPDFQVDYAKGFDDHDFFTNLHLVDLKKSATILCDVALVDLHLGNDNGAVQNVCSALALTEALKHQRLVISELVRFAMVSNAHNPTWEILQSENIPDKDLATLQSAWERLKFVPGLIDALTMERLVGDRTLSKQRQSNAELEKYLGIYQAAWRSMGDDEEVAPTLFQRAKFRVEVFLWRYWWSYRDELRSLRGSEILEKNARRAETNGEFSTLLHRQQVNLEKMGLVQVSDKLANPLLLIEQPDLHSMLSDSVITLSGCLRKVMNIETLRSLTITAIALKRYQLKHGDYPPDLTALVPEFISAVPLDPVDGQPLRYRRNADGTFLLYSVGENGVDDGGDPSLEKGVTGSNFNWQNPHALDWVWPQPATANEIQKYYEEQAKKATN